jgi:hypothetical protein
MWPSLMHSQMLIDATQRVEPLSTILANPMRILPEPIVFLLESLR